VCCLSRSWGHRADSDGKKGRPPVLPDNFAIPVAGR
jgi:hypothetical protein